MAKFQNRRIDEASSSTSQNVKSERLQQGGSNRHVQISDSLFKLYEPVPPLIKSIDIIFFHGLQFEHDSDGYLSTWRSGDTGQEVWRERWLPAKYPRARTLSEAYDASTRTTRTQGRMDMHLIGENLFQEILWVREKQVNECPVVLVGQSFGRLVIKQLCLHDHKNKENPANGQDVRKFLESIRGIFFYGTPHRGYNPAVLWTDSMLSSMSVNKPLLSFIEVLGKDAVRLHEEFEQRRREYKWIIYGLGELHDERRKLENVCKNVVGVESLLIEVQKLLQEHTFLGFCGAGGVGKTTLARLAFNILSATFEYTCFVSEVNGCGLLERLPETFGNLSSLKHLQISQCGSLKGLPETFGNLSSSLEHMELNLGTVVYLKDCLRHSET